MITLKNLIYSILLENKETRDSDKKLIWEVWCKLGFAYFSITNNNSYIIDENTFIKTPPIESIRRCRQSLQRTDLLSGAKLIQPSPKIKETRVKLSKEKGASYMMGKFEFDEVSQTYKEL